jgi:hypothetical protein
VQTDREWTPDDFDGATLSVGGLPGHLLSMRWLWTVIAISDNDVSHSTALSALAIVRPETVIRWHPLAV